MLCFCYETLLSKNGSALNKDCKQILQKLSEFFKTKMTMISTKISMVLLFKEYRHISLFCILQFLCVEIGEFNNLEGFKIFLRIKNLEY